ncbi:MAG: FG-GAP-like repeat-containing protein [Ferruginibacter sp.]
MKKYLLYIILPFLPSYLMAQPTISSFSPASGPIGTSVIISGTGFSIVPANNIVFFGAVKGTVLNAASNVLTVQVPVSASHGLITVAVGQLMAYSKKPFAVTFATVAPINAACFPIKTDISAPGFPAFTLLKDMNDDGKPDLVYGTAGVTFHRNTSSFPTISFGSPTTLASGSPNYITIEDMDCDGKPDILVPDYTQPLRVYRNISSSGGTISMSAPYTIMPTVSTFGISTQDLDGDGRPDVVTTNNDAPAGRFSIFRNTSSAGSISLSLVGDYATASSYPRGVSFGYINSDDKPDMIIANQSGGNISVYLNTSTPGNISFGPFTNFSPLSANSFCESIAVADFDGDGKDDLAVGNNNSSAMGTVSVFRNTTTGATATFAPPLILTTGMNWNPYVVTAGDLDGDGIPEIAVSNQVNNAVSVFRNNSTVGTLSFNLKFDLLRTGSPSRSAIAITDVDGDRRQDVISASYSPNVISIFANNIQILPVKFLSFKALKNSSDVYLEWVVENETDQTDWYEIERSFTGTTFIKLYTIQKNTASGSHSYHFTDLDIALPGVKNIYYRVKQIDKDGKAAYTEIRRVGNEKEEKEIDVTVYPNPVYHAAVLNFFLPAAGNVSFSVFDASGKVIQDNMSMNALNGFNRKLINMRGMKAGIYYIKICTQDICKTIPVIKSTD